MRDLHGSEITAVSGGESVIVTKAPIDGYNFANVVRNSLLFGIGGWVFGAGNDLAAFRRGALIGAAYSSLMLIAKAIDASYGLEDVRVHNEKVNLLAQTPAP